jgi:uncharacterized delta-60 repeat protein
MLHDDHSLAGSEYRAAGSRARRNCGHRILPRIEALDRRMLLAASLTVLDPTFGTGGLVQIGLTHGTFAAAAIAAQPDGKIVVAGQSAGALGAARFNADGSPDAGFGAAGTGLVLTDATPRDDQANAVGIAPDGGIVVAGTNTDQAGPLSGSNGDVVLVKYTAAGLPDASFGNGGVVVTDVGGRDDLAVRLLVQADAKIVLAGFDREGLQGVARSHARLVMVRYNSDGTLDPSFGSAGITITDLPSDHEQPTGAALGPNGTLLVAAHGSNLVAPDQAFVLRYTSTGTLDPAFGSGGIVEMPSGTALSDVASTTDGNVLACGSVAVTTGRTTQRDFVLWRFAPDGTPDSQFGRNGEVVTNFGRAGSSQADDGASALALIDGAVVAAGSTNAVAVGVSPGARRVAIAKYAADGKLDARFGRRGKVTEELGPGDSFATGLVPTQDRKVLIFGGNAQGAFLARAYSQAVPRFAKLTGGVLRLHGTQASDRIAVAQPGGTIDVDLNGFVQHFTAADVRRIVVSGGRGDDTIAVDSAVTVPAILSGGAGADTLTGGGAADRLAGGAGDDTLFCRDSVGDIVLGGGGRDAAQLEDLDRVRQVEVLLE